MTGLAYLDASAFVKLPVVEAESDELRQLLPRFAGTVSSELLRVEALRAAIRRSPEYVQRTRDTLRQVLTLPIDLEIQEHAGRLEPPGLRSLDAIHLATALSLGDDLGVFVAYDQRLLDAAEAAGLPTASPGA